MSKSLENWISRLAVAGIFLPPSLSACWPSTWNDPAIRKWTLEQMRTSMGFFSLTFFLFPLFTTGILDYRLSKNNVSVTIKYYFVRLWAFHCSSFHFSKIKHICFEKVEEVQKIFISSGKIINSNFQLLLWPSFWRLQSTFLLDTLAYVKLWSYHQSLVAKLKRMIND